MTHHTFEELQLVEFVQKAITDLGFEAPSIIQSEAIPKIMNGDDIIAMAPTGSGKTFAFAIPALQKINAQDESIQVLVLCPTRELVIQAHKEFEKLTKYNEEIKVVSVYGGQQIDKQFNALKRRPQVLIATPGRLMDHIKRRSVNIGTVYLAVLDEADEMLDMGFRDDIHEILGQTNEARQTILFSATMEKNIMEIAKKFQKQPLIVDVIDNLKNAPDIEQFYFESSENDKPELIARLLDLHKVKQALVFCNTKSNVDRLVEILKAKSFQADAIHGDLNQSQREKVMRGFQKNAIKVLVATDVAGRGIDVKNLQAVFNYDLPRDDEDYIHRIGRTGRAGQTGVAFSFISKKQVSSLRRIERANGLKITKCECPSIEELDNARFSKYIDDIKEMNMSADIEEFREKIRSMADENLSELDIAAALYKMMIKNEQSKIDRKRVFEKLAAEAPDENNRKRSFGGFGNRNAKSSRDFYSRRQGNNSRQRKRVKH